MQKVEMLVLTVNRFEADPSVVSTILNLEPTRIAREGAVSPCSGRTYRHNQWELDVHPQPLSAGGEHEAGLLAILALLRGRQVRFAQLRQEVRPEEVTIYGGLYHRRDQQCGIWLNPDQMRTLAECEVGWGLDIFSGE